MPDVRYDPSNEYSQEDLRMNYQKHAGAAQAYSADADSGYDNRNVPGNREFFEANVQLSLMHSQLAMAFAAGLHGGIGT